MLNLFQHLINPALLLKCWMQSIAYETLKQVRGGNKQTFASFLLKLFLPEEKSDRAEEIWSIPLWTADKKLYDSARNIMPFLNQL